MPVDEIRSVAQVLQKLGQGQYLPVVLLLQHDKIFHDTSQHLQ